MCNQRTSIANSSGFKGVTWSNAAKKWVAQITMHRKNRYLGLFDTPEEAHAAYVRASAEVHGEFGRVA
jgi:hypothetical protein